MNFGDRLTEAVERTHSNLCVGLDPRFELLPPGLVAGLRAGAAGRARAYERFCEAVIEAVADEAVAVKPQLAFFEALGGPGIAALERVCLAGRAAGLLVVADGKRGDIDSTAAAYAEAWLRADAGRAARADALTVNPYLGRDALAPFVEACDDGAGLFVLVQTSNPGAADLQGLAVVDGAGAPRPLWEHVAGLVAELGEGRAGAGGVSAVGAVVGATRPDAVARACELMPRAPLLLPGVGAQGGRARDLVSALGSARSRALVAEARSVIYAWRERPGAWQAAIREAARRSRAALDG